MVAELLDNGTLWYSIREVYYIDGEMTYTVSPEAAVGESAADIRRDLVWMLRDAKKPVLYIGENEMLTKDKPNE